tara:strand:+ start:1231 stop:1602 length:372 start_codon:yes stop_codon:yes gene_type:complete
MARIKAINDNILCTEGDFGETTTSSGIIVQKTIGKESGITPRWFKVFEVGPDIDWLEPGQWVYVAYGRWTEGFKVKDDRFDTEDGKDTIWKVEPDSCLAISNEKPKDHLNLADTQGDVFNKTR